MRLGVAIVAFLAKSRLVFAFGFIGCCLSLFIPRPVVYADYRTAEAATMAGFSEAASHSLTWGTVYSTGGVLAGLAIRRIGHSGHGRRPQLPVRSAPKHRQSS